jgi:4-methoxybenzoate monooxygenase (O-demethylating)
MQQPEAEAILTALARRVASLDLTGEPERRSNNTRRGCDSLLLRLEPV